MSTCPDSDLYSAYVDGEVPSPWKEKLEAHIAVCPKCRERAERFKKMHAFISAGVAPVPDLESSYARLCARRAEFVTSVGGKQGSKIPDWIHFSVRMPIAAFAALFLAALFLPALFVLRTSSNLKTQHEEFSLIRQDVQSLKELASTNQVYSPDLSTRAVPVRSIADSGKSVFTMVDYARQFAGDQDLFSNANIIIIKLPQLTNFSDTDELFHASNEPVLQAAGYYK